MKKRIFLILFIILIIIAILTFFVINSDTYSESAEEYFNRINKNNENAQEIVDNNTNSVFSEPKMAEDGTLGEVTKKLKEGTVTNSSAILIITNRTNVKFNDTSWFSIEEKINDEWVAINSKENINVESNTIMPNQSVELKLDWSKVYGILEKRRI